MDDLTGRHILVVEDEYFIAEDMAQTLRDHGAETVGPAATIDEALALVETSSCLDGAVLDVNLGGQWSYPVADALMRRGVHLVFTTGYDRETIREPYRLVLCCEKPVSASKLVALLNDRDTVSEDFWPQA